jgi:Protein of unknown function (DUF3037)
MSSEPYSFSFLRYVHEPLSGEFANVGVLLWAPRSRFLGFKASHKYRRLSHFFDGFHHQDYRSLISRIETKFEGLSLSLADAQIDLPLNKEPESARDLAFRVIPFDDAAFQWSASGGGLTTSPQAELEGLYHEAVGRHYDSDDEPRRDESVIYREIYSRAFESPVVSPHISEHEVTSPLAVHKFPQAWKNGVWNVYQPLSFDLKRSEDIKSKAYRWESLTRFLAQSSEHPKIHLLLGAPGHDHQQDYIKARDVLNSSKVVTLVEENEADDFAKDLESRVLAAG